MEREIDKFSWSGLFFVTACCCFLFSLTLKILDGQFSFSLLIISGAAAALGVLSLAVGAFERQFGKKRKNKRFVSSDF